MHAEIAQRHLAGLEKQVAARPSKPLWRSALSALFTVAVLACAVYLSPARLGGSTNMVVVRGTSMEPVYHLNDVVISREADNYEVGDIVLFSIPEGAGEGMLVIHRLMGQRDDGSWVTQVTIATRLTSSNCMTTTCTASPSSWRPERAG